jgi:hypothetical protein
MAGGVVQQMSRKLDPNKISWSIFIATARKIAIRKLIRWVVCGKLAANLKIMIFETY